MKGNLIEKTEPEENHLVRATLLVNGCKIIDVPCKIFLPERIQEKPYIILKPDKENAIELMVSHKGSLSASVQGFDRRKELTIETPKVYLSKGTTKYWGSDISVSTVIGEPQDLHIVHHHKGIENDDIKHTNVIFWISSNKFLSPDMLITSSYTGNLEYKRMNNLCFEIIDGLNLSFDKHFHSKKGENGDFIQWSNLVACTDIEIAAHDSRAIKTKILPDIDDFLLIASFATRQRTVCLGWTAADKDSESTFYRGDYVFPNNDGEHDIDRGIIDIRDIESFMKVGHQAFLGYNNKLALRNALYAVLPKGGQTVETSFLKKFAGLETLILDFRRNNSLEYVIEETEWLNLKKYLKKCIKNSTVPKLEKTQRASIYRKLDELNRVSLRESFDIFCKNYSINLLNLWPVFGGAGLVGLVDIRNKLIHGDPIPQNMFGAVIVAKEHLNYVLETIIVHILSWDIEKTKIKTTYLNSQMTVMKDWLAEREKISEYILG